MTIQEQLLQDMKAAMKAKEDGKVALSVIRMVRASIKNAEIDGKQPLSEEDILAILAKEMKLRKDSLAEFEKSNRNDLVEQTKAEMEILKKYLPTPLTAEEIRAIIVERMQGLPKEEINFGAVMKQVMPQLKGRADGQLVNAVVKEYLTTL